MNDRQINQWLRRQFTVIGWVLLGYHVIMTWLAGLSASWSLLGQALGFPGQDPSGNSWGYVLAVAVGLTVLHSWKGTDYLTRELTVKNRPMTLGAAAALVSLCMGAQLANSLWVSALETGMNVFGKSLMPMLESVSGASGTVSMFLYASILAPISEEILFRGYVLRSLQPYGKRFAILFSALLFGFFHGNLLQMPYAWIVGLVLGYIAVEYSIFWSISLHIFNNLVLADGLSRLLNQLPEPVAGMVNLLIFGGFALAAIVLLVKNRHAIGAYRRENWLDRRCVRCFFTNSGILILLILMALSMLSLFFL